jgi:hypothetical protein
LHSQGVQAALLLNLRPFGHGNEIVHDLLGGWAARRNHRDQPFYTCRELRILPGRNRKLRRSHERGPHKDGGKVGFGDSFLSAV